MKKTILSIAALAMLAIGANAQDIKSDETLLSYPGSDKPYSYVGFPDADQVDAVGAEIDDNVTDQLPKLKEILGLRFAVTASLGKSSEIFAIIKYEDQSTGVNWEKDLKDGDYTVSELNGNKLTLKWNTVYFDEPYKIDGTLEKVRYGYFYTQDPNKGTTAARPILFGKTDDQNSGNAFLVLGTLSDEYGYTWYPYAYTEGDNAVAVTPCMQLICKMSDGTNAIIGVNGSGEAATAEGYYTLGGEKLSAPQNGVNVVKMSDGTSRKVIVRK